MTEKSGNPSEREQWAREAGARGNSLFESGQYKHALDAFETAVYLVPGDIGLRYNLALAAWACGDLMRTRAELDRIVSAASEFAKAHDALARLDYAAGDFEVARARARRAVELEPGEAEFALTYANCLVSLERWSEAWDAVRPAMDAIETADRAATLCARMAKPLKRDVEAVEIIHRALARPAGKAEFRKQLHFTASALFDRVGRYDEAFEQARLAHELLRRPYDPVARAGELERRIAHWTRARVGRLARATHGSERPVFVVGMPRSGTSLVEQVLGCHPKIFAAGETIGMNRTAKALDALGMSYPQSLEALTTELANEVAGVYLEFIGRLDGSRGFVTDKMPLNFMYLDLMQVLLPDCHVIHCVRDSIDTCLSCYMTEFETPYDFADELRNLGAFYANYRKLMAHWQAVLSLKILEVRYEDVVSDLEGQTRRMLEFLGLEWDEKCLRFYESRRVVNTASREQVRRPVYSTSVGRWKHYARHLEPLREGLDSLD